MSEIELGNGLPDVRSTADVVAALRKAGFEVLEATDLAPLAEVAWWEPLAPRWLSLSGESQLLSSGAPADGACRAQQQRQKISVHNEAARLAGLHMHAAPAAPVCLCYAVLPGSSGLCCALRPPH